MHPPRAHYRPVAEPEPATRAEYAERVAERDARIDDRDAAAKLLGDPPSWRCARSGDA